jgi:hypothetical protein
MTERKVVVMGGLLGHPHVGDFWAKMHYEVLDFSRVFADFRGCYAVLGGPR